MGPTSLRSSPKTPRLTASDRPHRWSAAQRELFQRGFSAAGIRQGLQPERRLEKRRGKGLEDTQTARLFKQGPAMIRTYNKTWSNYTDHYLLLHNQVTKISSTIFPQSHVFELDSWLYSMVNPKALMGPQRMLAFLGQIAREAIRIASARHGEPFRDQTLQWKIPNCKWSSH
jgi:hypothetical protein